MRSDNIIQKARDKAGLNDFDCESFREGLDVAASLVDANPLRSEERRASLEKIYVKLLTKRLELADYARRHPEARDGAIERPIFILGLPRTGAAMVSNLLGADKKYRSLLRWEVSHPTPPPTTETLFSNPTLKALQDKDWDALKADKSQAAIYYEMPEGPTECGRVTVQDFKATRIESSLAHLDYSNWLLQADLRSAYEYHRLFLQVLQSHAPGSWVLKLPSHALAIHTLIEMYPDARFIWTHRDPFIAAASYMSTLAAVQARTLPGPDVKHIAAAAPPQLREHVMRPLSILDAGHADRFFHMQYGALARDPLAQMSKLYEWLGDDLSRETVHAMRNWLFIFQKGNFGDHAYALDQFGLSKKDLVPYFEDYLKRFEIEPDELT